MKDGITFVNTHIDVSFLYEDDPRDYGYIPWEVAQFIARQHLDLSEETCAALRGHFFDFGAWDEEEIVSWDKDHLAAMVVQDACADLRDYKGEGRVLYTGGDGSLSYWVGV